MSIDIPWTVFADEAAILAEPHFGASRLGRLVSGDTVAGEAITNPATDEPWLEIEYGPGRAFVTLTALHRVHPANLVEGAIAIGSEVVNRWWGMPLGYVPGDLETIPAELTIPDGKEYLLRAEPLRALKAMLAAAGAEGVVIRTDSAYRSGERQTMLYTRAVAKDGASQRYSAPPGHSEHQLGTTVDLTDPDEKFAFTAEFADTPQGLWLAAHAERFGFRRTYRDDNTAETGYIPEPWHWRYVGQQYGQ